MIQKTFLTLLFAAIAVASMGADGPPKVFPVPIVKAVDTPPVPPPGAVATLQPDQIYIVTSEVKFVLDATPDGLVDISAVRSGPVTFYGNFFDGGDEPEFRDYTAKFLAVVRARRNVSGLVTLSYIKGIDGPDDLQKRQLRIGTLTPGPVNPDVVPDKPAPSVDPFTLKVREITAKYKAPQSQRDAVARGLRHVAADLESGKIADTRDLMKVSADMLLKEVGINDTVAWGWTDWRNDLLKYFETLPLTNAKDNAAPLRKVADVLEGK